MDSNKGFAHVFLFFLVVLIAIGAIILYSFRPTDYESCMKFPGSTGLKSIPPACNSPFGTFTNTSFPIENFEIPTTDNSDWKSYTSSKFGFQISYPNTWVVDDTKNSDNVSFAPPTASEDNLSDGVVLVIPNYVDLNIANLREATTTYKNNVAELSEYSETEYKTIGDKEYWIAIGGCCMDIGVHAFVLDGTSLTRITLYDITADASEKEIQNFYQILSTFEFTKTISELLTSEMPNGDIKITNPAVNVEIIVPVTYTLSGNSQKYSVSFQGPDSNQPGPHDFSSLDLSLGKLNGNSLLNVVQNSFKNSDGENQPFDEVQYNNLSGYVYDCFFLTSQSCIFLQLNNDNYLYILASYADDNNRGYAKEINEILSSIRKMN